jgi:ribosomal protein L31E
VKAGKPPAAARRRVAVPDWVNVAIWRKGDNDLGARLRLIASSSDELEKARS